MSVFSINSKVFFGFSSLYELFDYCKEKNLINIMIIIDKAVIENNRNQIEDFCTLASKNSLNIIFIDELPLIKEPTYDFVDQLKEKYYVTNKLNLDVIFSIGGGSIMDISKAIGILGKNKGKAITYRGMNKVKKSGIPVICFPTTMGSGSEATHTASLIDNSEKKKLGINGMNVSPLAVCFLPEFTYTIPKSVLINSCLDAMLHAIEAVTSIQSTTISEALGCQAFALLYNNIEKAINEPDDYIIKQNLMFGSYLAGIAMMHSAGGIASALSYPLGVHYNVPHGIAGGIILKHEIKHNLTSESQDNLYDMLYDTIRSSVKFNILNAFKTKSEIFYSEFCKMYKRIGAIESLKEMNFNIESEFLTNLTMSERKDVLNLNPVEITEKQVKEIFERIK